MELCTNEAQKDTIQPVRNVTMSLFSLFSSTFPDPPSFLASLWVSIPCRTLARGLVRRHSRRRWASSMRLFHQPASQCRAKGQRSQDQKSGNVDCIRAEEERANEEGKTIFNHLRISRAIKACSAGIRPDERASCARESLSIESARRVTRSKKIVLLTTSQLTVIPPASSRLDRRTVAPIVYTVLLTLLRSSII